MSICIFCANLGNYENLECIEANVFDGIDTFLFSDHKDIHVRGGQSIYVEHNNQAQLMARKIKMLAEIARDYDYSIWVDGNCFLKEHPNTLIDFLNEKDIDISAMRHPIRNCTYNEARMLLREKQVTSCMVNNQVCRYKREGLPYNWGMMNTCVTVRRTCDQIDNFNKLWWEELKHGSRRDQIAIMYALWKTQVKWDYLPFSFAKQTRRHAKLRYKTRWGGWHMEDKLFQVLNKLIPHGKTILEFGSGWSSGEIGRYYDLYSIEHNEEFLNKYGTNYIHAPLKDNWYDIDYNLLPKKYDCLIIDGPPTWTKSRKLGDVKPRLELLKHVDKFNLSVPIFVDDICIDGKVREDDLLLGQELEKITGRKGHIITGNKKKFMLIL